MKRRTFLKVLAGSLFPALTYAALKPDTTSIIEGTTPAKQAMSHAPTVLATDDGWPMWQYGDYIRANHHLSAEEIADYKFLCREQAKETFAALQVPDACDKLEYVVHQMVSASPDPWAQFSTVAWKVTIPAPAWQWVLSKHSDKPGMLKQILRTRKRFIPISLNGNTQMIPRGYVRDYLRLVAK